MGSRIGGGRWNVLRLFGATTVGLGTLLCDEGSGGRTGGLNLIFFSNCSGSAGWDSLILSYMLMVEGGCGELGGGDWGMKVR